jgi:hypothetical protein
LGRFPVLIGRIAVQCSNRQTFIEIAPAATLLAEARANASKGSGERQLVEDDLHRPADVS